MVPEHDHDNRSDPAANDNNRHEHEGGAVAPAPSGGALAALATLGKMLNAIDTTSVLGYSGRPMLQFKSREDTWSFGARRTIPEEGSLWAVNPTTFQHGYISFGDNNKVLGERLVSIGLPKPDVTKLPDTGHPWQEEWAVGLRCISGADAGVEVVFKSNTRGGNQAVVGLIEVLRDRLNSGQHDGKMAPIVRLEKDSYPHSQYGRIAIPLMTIVDWMPLGGPAPAPAPASPPQPSPQAAPQPRRRRVG
jgi:hypothetical protein